MIQPFINLFKLIRIVRERGNWPLIRHSQQQLRNFILCRNDINRKCLLWVPFYWFGLLKGLDMLVWRLETFGFLFQPDSTAEQRSRLNRHIES